MRPPLCFVAMPFGRKVTASGTSIDFDAVYDKLLRPAIEAARMTPLRADQEMVGGIIHKPMFERLLLCDFAVVDLTSANANVYYELGVRHAVRRHTTVLVSAAGERLVFDVAPDRAMPYRVSAAGRPAGAAAFVSALTARLAAARHPSDDSPIYQLLGDWPAVSHSKTDVFHEVVAEESATQEELAAARDLPDKRAAAAVRKVVAGLGDLADVSATVAADALLSLRAVEAWDDVVAFVERLPVALRDQTLVREQYGMALNRAKRHRAAERVLVALRKERGATPETCGILGRVYKDLAAEAVKAGKHAAADKYRQTAITTYLQGFEADWRDAYPGINALTLMTEADPTDPRIAELNPVVAYAVRRKIASGRGDYWDHATLVELAVLARDESAANDALADALTIGGVDGWMYRTTADTLERHATRTRRRWVRKIADELASAAEP